MLQSCKAFGGIQYSIAAPFQLVAINPILRGSFDRKANNSSRGFSDRLRAEVNSHILGLFPALPISSVPFENGPSSERGSCVTDQLFSPS